MINWTRVNEVLNNYLKSQSEYNIFFDDLLSVLLYLYQTKKLSIRQITNLTEEECSNVSLREKMKELGIKMRSKGGPNYTKPFEISKEEYKEFSYKELAFKHGVHRTTIHKRCQKYIKEIEKKSKVDELRG